MQDHCPNLLTLTDLVVLEPKLLLTGDPSALGTRTWQAIRQVAESICQLMTWQGTHRTPHTAASWQGTISFCDTVPVCDFKPALPCLQQPSANDTWRLLVHFPYLKFAGHTWLRSVSSTPIAQIDAAPQSRCICFVCAACMHNPLHFISELLYIFAPQTLLLAVLTPP